MADQPTYTETTPGNLKPGQYTTQAAGDFVARRPGDGLLEGMAVRALPDAQPDARNGEFAVVATALFRGPDAIEALAKKGVSLDATNMITETGTSTIAAQRGPATYGLFLKLGGKANNSLYEDRIATDAQHLISGHGVAGLNAAQVGGLKLTDPQQRIGGGKQSPTTLQEVVVYAGAKVIESYASQGGTFKPTYDLVRALESLSRQASEPREADRTSMAIAALDTFAAVSGTTPAKVNAEYAQASQASARKFSAMASGRK